MKTQNTIKKEIQAFIIMSMQSGGMNVKDSKFQAKIATTSIMNTITPLFKKEESNGKALKYIYDFYIKVYESKFGEKAIWNISWVNATKSMLKSILGEDGEMEDKVNMLACCIYAYFYKVDNSFVENAGHPFGLISQNLTQLKMEVKSQMKFYNIAESDYCKKYLNDVVNKLNLGVTKYDEPEQKNK